jgi:hypothetical protein
MQKDGMGYDGFGMKTKSTQESRRHALMQLRNDTTPYHT